MATLNQKIKLLRGLLSGGTAYAGPFYLDFELTTRCNITCIGCPYHSPHVKKAPKQETDNTDISVDLFRNLCRELKAVGAHSLILKGSGEPLLHKNMLDLLSIAKESGLHVTIYTNGTLLDSDMIRALMDLRLDTLKITMWASSVEQYKLNHPGTNPDYFNKVVNSLKELAAVKSEMNGMLPHVELHHPLNRYNFRTIDKFVDLALDSGINSLSFSPFFIFSGGMASAALSHDEEESMLLSLQQAKKQLKYHPVGHNIDEALLRYEYGSKVWQKFPCYITWIYLRIMPDGQVLPCCRCNEKTDLGNLNDNSFQEIWNGSAIRDFRRKALTPGGVSAFQEDCNCDFCSFVGDNQRVHRIFKWFLPFISTKERGDIIIKSDV